MLVAAAANVADPFDTQGVPNDEAPCNVNISSNCGMKPGNEFDFKRLGLRSSAMLISPWVEKGAVFQEPECSAEKVQGGKCPGNGSSAPPAWSPVSYYLINVLIQQVAVDLSSINILTV